MLSSGVRRRAYGSVPAAISALALCCTRRYASRSRSLRARRRARLGLPSRTRAPRAARSVLVRSRARAPTGVRAGVRVAGTAHVVVEVDSVQVMCCQVYLLSAAAHYQERCALAPGTARAGLPPPAMPPPPLQGCARRGGRAPAWRLAAGRGAATAAPQQAPGLSSDRRARAPGRLQPVDGALRVHQVQRPRVLGQHAPDRLAQLHRPAAPRPPRPHRFAAATQEQ